MRLTKSADFALRLVIFLARRPETHTMHVLSDVLHIPYNNLSKIVQHLGKAQILTTRQGKNGGVQLQKPAFEVTLRNIIEVIDGPILLSECLCKPGDCKLSSGCDLRNAFFYLQQKMNGLFDSITIDALAKKTWSEEFQ